MSVSSPPAIFRTLPRCFSNPPALFSNPRANPPGPYIYALYEYYGYDMGLIGVLFVAGFGSSMVFGTALGSVADRCVSAVWLQRLALPPLILRPSPPQLWAQA